MNKYFALLLLLGSAASSPLLASTPTLPQVFPVVRQPRPHCPSPLLRYLTATLRLTPTQAAAVQQALRAEVPHSLAPEQLARCLDPVLSPEAQERLQLLQANVDSYRALYSLAARH